MAKNNFHKVLACAREGKFFRHNQKMRKGELFKMITVRFIKKISEVKKKGNTNFSSLGSGQKNEL